MACLLNTQANALELEFGLGYSLQDPWYQSVSAEDYPDQYDDHIVGKFGISHTFEVREWVGIKVWIDHYSLIRYSEPEDNITNENNLGKNLLGTSLVFKIF